jgi:isopenicillin N synthase-like dioxygenase
MPRTEFLNYKDPVKGRLQDECPLISAQELMDGKLHALAPIALRSCLEQGFLCIDLDEPRRHALDNTLASMQAFFANDVAHKSRVELAGGQNGWTPSGQEPAYQPGTVSNVESFDVMSSLIAGQDDGKWPESVDFFRSTTACWLALFELAGPLLDLIAHAAGIRPGFLREHCSTQELNTLRLLHYPPDPGSADSNDVGIAAHTDFECITLLYQSAPGLELRTVDGRWLDAPTRSERLIVLLGDMLEVWTNGYLQATGHRVRRTMHERFSVVMFIAVNDGLYVEPLADFISADRPIRYTGLDQKTHINSELAEARNSV